MSVTKEQVDELRGGIAATAEKSPLPKRFEVINEGDLPSVTIVDTESGRSVSVPLFAYRQVRETLDALFGEQV
jgi:hypothetical protein